MKKFFLALLALLIIFFNVSLASNNSHSVVLKERLRYSKVWSSKATADPDSLINALLPLIKSDSIEAYVQQLQGFGTRFCLAPNHKDVALWLQSKLQSFGYANVVLDSFQLIEQWPFGSGIMDTSWQYNVVADLTGTTSPEVHYITGGHYDSVILSGDAYAGAPGADDNASGTAATLEIARVMKTQNFEPGATVRFVLFSAEELGLNGSIKYVTDAIASQEIIPMMVNMDMIGHEMDSTGWKLQLQAYKGSEWVRDAAIEIATTYTSLATLVNMNDAYVGSDSDPFFLSGYSTVFLQEDQFSPQYHTMADVDSNMNFPYAAEITRVACGMLIKASLEPTIVNFRIHNAGDGQSLEPRWKPNPENDIAGYNVSIGTASEVYDTTYFTTDTLFNISGLQNGVVYYLAVTAVNSTGYEGPSRELTDAPALVTMNQGVLIVDDSEGGYLNPLDSVIDRYYRGLCTGFELGEYDAISQGAPDLNDLGKYSSVIWHNNKPNAVNTLLTALPEIVQYLELGGNILFTQLQPTKNFTGNASFPAYFRPDYFLFDIAGIDSTDYVPSSCFIRAQPLAAGFPLLEIDTMKTLPINQHHMPYTDAIYPHNPADAIYAFDSDYDSTVQQGRMDGRHIGISHQGNGYKIVIMSIPLFYIDSTQAHAFTQYVLEDVFGEVPSAIAEIQDIDKRFTLYPNPAQGTINIHLNAGVSIPDKVEILDISGRIVMQRKTFDPQLDVSLLENGMYFLRLFWKSEIKQLPVVIMK